MIQSSSNCDKTRIHRSSIIDIWIILGFALIGAIDAARSVTYEGIGTFTTDDFYDIRHRPIVYLPSSPEEMQVKFQLFTPQNSQTKDFLIWKNESSIRESHFNGLNPTKIIVHGYNENVQKLNWPDRMKDGLLHNGDFNVVIVDWGEADGPIYGKAVANTRVIGPMIAILIQDLCQVANTDVGQFHIIGHSLGAHVAGAAGKFLNGTLGRITGLDPAGPSYRGMPPEARLWHTDAKFVDNIHTNGQRLFPYLGFGMYETCGHVDLYPNGGRTQPGCFRERITSIFTESFAESFRRVAFCFHIRSVDFYTETLERKEISPKAFLCENYRKFLNGQCKSCGQNGEKCVILGLRSIEWTKTVDNLGNGGKRFFLRTRAHHPFFR